MADKKQIKIVYYSPTGAGSAQSFYRGIPQLSLFGRVTIIEGDRPSWEHFCGEDVLYIQSPTDSLSLAYIDYAQHFGLKVWLDIDDNHWVGRHDASSRLLEVMPTFKDNATKAIEMLRPNIDALTVSNKNILPYLNIGKVRHEVVDAWLPQQVLSSLGAGTLPKEPKSILVRGHVSDSEKAALIEVYKMFDNVTWIFVGCEPAPSGFGFASDHSRGVTVYSRAWEPDLMDYFKILREDSGHVCLKLLADTPFNQCRSNTHMLESALFGRVSVGPNYSRSQTEYRFDNGQIIPTSLFNAISNGLESVPLHHDLISMFRLDQQSKFSTIVSYLS